MNKVSYAIKIDPHIVNRVKKFCLEHGLKLGFFVEKALQEQLAREELTEDLLDFKNLRSQEKNAISFAFGIPLTYFTGKQIKNQELA